jgi:16S rRNA (guanine(966)-N(2))-methyltransferase RsmD
MRIVAGALKGRRLESPSWTGLRPTSDKLRETLFNVLASRVPGARVLDGYAGTGAVGLEAISRGARHVTFVERDRRAQALIAVNVARCGVSDGYAIIGAAVLQAIATLRNEVRREDGALFDLILLDPPYASPRAARSETSAADAVSDDTREVLDAVGTIVAPGGLVVLEHARKVAAPATAGVLRRTRVLASGDSALTFYTCQP